MHKIVLGLQYLKSKIYTGKLCASPLSYPGALSQVQYIHVWISCVLSVFPRQGVNWWWIEQVHLG